MLWVLMIWTNSPAKSHGAERWSPAQPRVSFSILAVVFRSAGLSSQFANLQLSPFHEACRTAEFSKKVRMEGGEAGSVVVPLLACFPALFTVCLSQTQPVLHPGLRCAVHVPALQYRQKCLTRDESWEAYINLVLEVWERQKSIQLVLWSSWCAELDLVFYERLSDWTLEEIIPCTHTISKREHNKYGCIHGGQIKWKAM